MINKMKWRTAGLESVVVELSKKVERTSVCKREGQTSLQLVWPLLHIHHIFILIHLTYPHPMGPAHIKTMKRKARKS